MIDEGLQELELVAIPMLADSKTLLKYGIVCTPNPLQAGRTGSQLAVIITNASSSHVTVKSIQVVLSVGTAAKNLIASKDFGTVDPPGWQAVPDGGTITLTPLTDEFAKVGERAVVVQITGLAINGEPGYTNVNIVENALTEQQPESMRLGAIELMKTPAQFQVPELRVDPVEIAYDGTTQVNWSGSPASYTLQYNAAGGAQKIEGLPNAGSHRADHIVDFPAPFTLTVSVAIPGDKPLVIQRQAFAQKQPELSVDDFSASASGFGVNEPVTLRWRTKLAKKCTLRINGSASPGIDFTDVSACIATCIDTRTVTIESGGKRVGAFTIAAGLASITFILSATDGSRVAQKPFELALLPAFFTKAKADLGGVRATMPLLSDGVFQEFTWEAHRTAGVTIERVGDFGPSGSYRRDGWDLTDPFTFRAAGFGEPAVVVTRMTRFASKPGDGLLRARGGASTLLQYSILPDPDPLQASAPDAPVKAKLTISATPQSQEVTVSSITISLLKGTTPRALTPTHEGITTVKPEGWSVVPDGTTFTLTPDTPAAGKLGEHGITFVIAGIAVNSEPGVTQISIQETASTESQPEPQIRITSVPLPKFPTQFAVGELQATPRQVDYDGQTILTWNGSPASYSLEFDPGDGWTKVPVANTGPFPARHLTGYPDVQFNLVVSVVIAGEPLVTVRTATVKVIVPQPKVTSFTSSVGDEKAILTWASEHADSCSLNSMSQQLNPSGTEGPFHPDRLHYTLAARSTRTRTASTPSTVNLKMTVVKQQALAPTYSMISGDLFITPDGSQLVAVSSFPAVWFVDTASLATLASDSWNMWGWARALSSDGRRFFISPRTGTDRQSGGRLAIFKLPPQSSKLEIAFPWLGSSDGPTGAAFSPDDRDLYVLYSSGSRADITMYVLDPATLATRRSSPLPHQFSAKCAVSSDGKRLYVAGMNLFSAIETATGNVIAKVPFQGSTANLVLDAVRNRAYVSTNMKTVMVFDTAGMKLLATIPVGPGADKMTLGPNGNEVFVAHSAFEAPGISVIDAMTLTVGTTFGLPFRPLGIALATGKTLRLYVLTDRATIAVLQVTG